MDNKPNLRARAKAVRAAIPPAERAAGAAVIARHLLSDDLVMAARTVYLYLSFGTEVATGDLATALAARRTRVVAPAPDRNSDPLRDAVRVKGLGTLPGGETATSATHPSDGFEPSEVDLFLVPGLAFDRHGHRLGYGGGFFDRLLAAARSDATIIGLSFDAQIWEPLPADPWDVRLNAVVTPARGIVALPCDEATSRAAQPAA